MAETTRSSRPLTLGDFPPRIAPYAIHRRDLAGLYDEGSLASINGWAVDGRSLYADEGATIWLETHGFRAHSGRWFRPDPPSSALAQSQASPHGMAPGSKPSTSPTPEHWVLRKTVVVSSGDHDVEIAQILTDDQIDAQGNLTGRGRADGLLLAAAPLMLALMEWIASDDRLPKEERGYVNYGIALATSSTPEKFPSSYK